MEQNQHKNNSLTWLDVWTSRTDEKLQSSCPRYPSICEDFLPSWLWKWERGKPGKSPVSISTSLKKKLLNWSRTPSKYVMWKNLHGQSFSLLSRDVNCYVTNHFEVAGKWHNDADWLWRWWTSTISRLSLAPIGIIMWRGGGVVML